MTSETSDYSWVASLTRRYEQATKNFSDADAFLIEQLTTLQFAATMLEKLALDKQVPERATHIVVMGPTQSGKSTLVNILLDSPAASVSALAGFTVHAQGYASKIDEPDITYVNHLMTPMQRVSGDVLDSANLDSYVLEAVSSKGSPIVKDAVIWDTPDFDSITAASYGSSVVRAAALADVIILTVSKDKYGDKRVWDMLDLFMAMGKPLLVCINKVNAPDRDVITSAFNTRFENVFGKPLPEMVILPFVERDESQTSLAIGNATLQLLQDKVLDVRKTVNKATEFAACESFINRYQEQWLQPLIAELDAREHWVGLIETAINDADEYYLTNYLDSPDKYETFNRALAELLTFLEIPGVATTLAQARKAITWPARRLLGVGRNLLGQQTEPARSTSGQILDHEALVLQHILDSTLIRLQRELLEAPSDIWWQALDSRLRTQLPAIRKMFEQTSEKARHEFEPEIEKAAASLYEQLRQQPALLNTLRAARASADAAGIALAVKSGGLAPTDLILAPAMLSVTTLLTESALGRYLDTIKHDLKRRQRQHIRTQVLEAALQESLLSLIEQLDRPELLTNAIEPPLMMRLNVSRGAPPA